MEIINKRCSNKGDDIDDHLVVNIYPLSNYYFTSKPASSRVAFKDDQTLADHALRLKSKYVRK